MNLGKLVRIIYLPSRRDLPGLLVPNWPQVPIEAGAPGPAVTEQVDRRIPIEETVSCTDTRP